MTQSSPIMAALEQFGATEANLIKLERLWAEIDAMTPQGIAFGSSAENDDRIRSYADIAAQMPALDGFRIGNPPMTPDEIAQNRLDAMELGEPEIGASVETEIRRPGRDLAEYRHRLMRMRRALIRDALVGLIDAIDEDVRTLKATAEETDPPSSPNPGAWSALRGHMREVEVLLGSNVPKPPRWTDMLRHVHFADLGDLNDVARSDWPTVKEALRKGLYGQDDPMPVAVADLGTLVAARPGGPVTAELAWGNLDDDGFERLVFSLIGNEPGYENAEWLMRTRAADRGRDLSVTRVTSDGLSGTRRERVVIQCKHWRSRSVALQDASGARDQMALWPHPPVDVLVIATSGRFTSDAVAWIEQHNHSGARPRIDMWAESHLERLLAERPALVAEAGLR